MLRIAALAVLLLLTGRAVRAAETLSPTALGAYYKISAQLAADTTQGLPENVTALAAGLKIPALQSAAQKLATPDLKQARDAFKAFNRLLVDAIKDGNLILEKEAAYRVHCPMVSADWLQAAKAPIRNPYHGSEMLECGGVMETVEAGPKK